jgi:hypothetical protein
MYGRLFNLLLITLEEASMLLIKSVHPGVSEKRSLKTTASFFSLESSICFKT